MKNKENKIKFTPPPINHMEVFEACSALIKTKDKTRTDKKACINYLETVFRNFEPNIHLDFDDGQGPNWTPLMFACYYNFKEGVKTLLELGADPNLPMLQDNKTVLEMVGVNSNIEIYEMLIKAGADPNFTNNHGKNLLMSAIESKGTKAKSFLIHVLNQDEIDLNIELPEGIDSLVDYANLVENPTASIIINHHTINKILNSETGNDSMETIFDFKI